MTREEQIADVMNKAAKKPAPPRDPMTLVPVPSVFEERGQSGTLKYLRKAAGAESVSTRSSFFERLSSLDLTAPSEWEPPDKHGSVFNDIDLGNLDLGTVSRPGREVVPLENLMDIKGEETNERQ